MVISPLWTLLLKNTFKTGHVLLADTSKVDTSIEWEPLLTEHLPKVNTLLSEHFCYLYTSHKQTHPLSGHLPWVYVDT